MAEIPNIEIINSRRREALSTGVLNLSGLYLQDAGWAELLGTFNDYFLKRIHTLDLSDNALKDPVRLERFRFLKVLHIYHNSLEDLYCVRGCKKLEVLDASYNLIREVTALRGLENLNKLSLEYNQLDYCPLGLFKKASEGTIELQIFNNPFCFSAGEASTIKCLEAWILKNETNAILWRTYSLNFVGLNLSAAGLKRVPFEILEMEHLESISLADNEITYIPEFWFSSIQFNPLSTEERAKLNILDIRLSDVSAAMPYRFRTDTHHYFPNLKSLDIRGNPLINRNMSDVADPVAYLNLLRKAESIANKSFKIVLLGNTRAGKSCLLDSLQGRDFDKNKNSTHGIVVEKWEVAQKPAALKDYDISIWDFGGQEYYHATHRLFLSENALYVIVWDANDNEFELKPERSDGAEYETYHFDYTHWLNAARYYGGKESPILVVQNKVDEIKDAIIQLLEGGKLTDVKKYQRNFGILSGEMMDYGVMGQFRMSLQNEIRPKDQPYNGPLKAPIEEWIKHSHKATFDTTVKIIKMLEGTDAIGLVEAKEKFIEKVSLNKEGYSDTDIEGVLNTLHESGHILYYRNHEKLRDYIYTRPKDITTAIYSVLQKGLIDKKGQFDKAILQNDPKRKLTEEEKKERELVEKIGPDKLIDLMLAFEIIFETGHGDGTYIAPQYAPMRDDHPLFKLAVAGTKPAFVLKFDGYFSNVFITRYIVKHGGRDKNNHTWRDGIVHVLDGHDKDNSPRVWVESRLKEKEIKLFCDQRDDERIADLYRDFLKFYVKDLPQETMGEENIKEEQLKDVRISIDNEYFIPLANLFNEKCVKIPLITAKNRDGNQEKVVPTAEFKRYVAQNLAPPPKQHKIFISYAREDASMKHRLRKHLSQLERDDLVKVWDDTDVYPGIYSPQIKENLENADYVFLLLSPDFIASDYIYKNELPLIALKDESKIIPILVHECDWRNYKREINGKLFIIQEYQLWPDYAPAHPTRSPDDIAVSSWPDPNTAFAHICTKLRNILAPKA